MPGRHCDCSETEAPGMAFILVSRSSEMAPQAPRVALRATGNTPKQTQRGVSSFRE